MPSPKRSRLSIAELLVMIAFAALLLMQWRMWRETWGREEEVILGGWLIAWTVGVFLGRMLAWTAMIPAALLCTAATEGVCLYFRIPWQSQALLAGAALLGALVTSPLPQAIVFAGHRLWRMATARPGRGRMIAALSVALVIVVLAVWQPWNLPMVWVSTHRALMDPLRDAHSSLHLAAVAPRGRFIVAYDDRKLVVVSSAGGTPRKIDSPSPTFPQCQFSQDGKLLAVLMDVQPVQVRLYEMPSLVERGSIRLAERPRSFAFLDDGRLCLGFAPDFHQVCFEVWQVRPEPQRVEQWKFDSGELATAGPYTPDGSHILVHPHGRQGEYLSWQLWQVNPPKKIADLDELLSPNYVAGAMSLHHDGDWWSCGRECWNLVTKKAYRIDDEPAGARPAAGQLAFVSQLLDPRSPTSAVMWLSSAQVTSPSQSTSASMYAVRFLTSSMRPPRLSWQEQTPFLRTRYVPEIGVRLRLWNLREPAGIWEGKVQSFEPDWRGYFSVAASPAGDAIAAMDRTGCIVLWRLSGRGGFPTLRPAKDFEVSGQ